MTFCLCRIAQTNTATEYFLGDALGSVRQLTAQNGQVTLAKSYAPYGEVTLSSGSSSSPFAYTGEQMDATGLTYLRARYYSPLDGRFMSRDTWGGEARRPLSMNRWKYVEGNPINVADPSGYCPRPNKDEDVCWKLLFQIQSDYDFIDLQTDLSEDNYWTYDELLEVQSALERYDQAAGLDLVSLYPEDVKIKRERIDEDGGDNLIVCGRTPEYFTSLHRPISIYNGFDERCILHELAHYLDFHVLDISKSFSDYVGSYYWFGQYYTGPESAPIYGNGFPPNRKEDFAESLEEYVMLFTNYVGDDIGIIPGEKRWYFIESVLNTGKAPSDNNDGSGCVPLGIALLD